MPRARSLRSQLVLTLFLMTRTPAFSAEPATSPDVPPDVLAAFETRTLTLPGGKRMRYHRRPGKGPALVLVPGTWGDLLRFEPLIARWPEDLPIVVIELCWQGGNVPPTVDLSMEQLADDVLEILSVLKPKRFFLGGHSIGGMITVEIAGREVPGLLGAIPLEGWTHHTVVKTAFAGAVGGKLTLAQEAQRQANRTRGRKHLSAEQLTAIARIWRRWNGYDALLRSNVPILHVWGDRGQPRPTRQALQIPDRPSIEIKWIANASHLLMLEAPDAVATAVLTFIRRHGYGPLEEGTSLTPPGGSR